VSFLIYQIGVVKISNGTQTWRSLNHRRVVEIRALRMVSTRVAGDLDLPIEDEVQMNEGLSLTDYRSAISATSLLGDEMTTAH
jgi:hypothetical protein